MLLTVQLWFDNDRIVKLFDSFSDLLDYLHNLPEVDFTFITISKREFFEK